jgi:hypothetical protein
MRFSRLLGFPCPPWQAVFIAILPAWALRQLLTTVELDEQQDP